MSQKTAMPLSLTKKEAETVVAGLRAALDFSFDYYMFAPGSERDYNRGSMKKCLEREGIARRIISRVEEELLR